MPHFAFAGVRAPRPFTRWRVSAAMSLSLAVAPLARAQAPDHALFDSLLHANVRDGLVAYDAFDASPAFGRYLAWLGATDPGSLGRADQLAFWINAYNAWTIHQVNRHHERASIRNINRTLGVVRAGGAWRERMAVIGGRTWTLDEIEHTVIRPRFRDARVHFALVCAAMGCPPLRSEAYVGARLDAQLDDQGRRFLRESPDKNRVDVAERTVHLSPIFISFRDYIDDFGGNEAAVGRFIARWYPPGPERDLLVGGRFVVHVTTYDWSLNALRRP